MTELSFLIELLLNHKLPKATKELIKERIGAIEIQRLGPSPKITQPMIGQAPSMQRAIEEMENSQPSPNTIIANSNLAAQALQDRQRLINKAVNSGPFGAKPEDGRTGPKKF